MTLARDCNDFKLRAFETFGIEKVGDELSLNYGVYLIVDFYIFNCGGALIFYFSKVGMRFGGLGIAESLFLGRNSTFFILTFKK